MNVIRLNRVLLRVLLLPVLALMLVSGILAWQLLSATDRVMRLQRIDHNIATISQVNALIVDQETGLRGFQVTGNPVYLQPYLSASVPLKESLDELREGVAPQKNSQMAVVNRLAADLQEWRTLVADPLIAATRTGVSTNNSVLNMAGKTRMDKMRADIKALIDDQEARRAIGLNRWSSEIHHIFELTFGMTLLAGILLGLFARSQLKTVSEVFRRNLDEVQRNALAVEDSEQRLRTTLRSIGDGVVVCDAEGCIELLNTVAEQLTGWTQREACRRHVDEVFRLVSEVSREPIENPVLTVKREHRVVSLSNHTLLIRRDGSEINIDDSAAPIYDHAGAPAGVVMVFRDITEQRHTQAALLASEKLAVAGRLAATIAHEIHNPLDAVINLLYLLRNNPSAEESRQFLDMASSELDRVAQISRAMLGMYRESRTPIALDISALLQSVLLLLARNFTQAEVAVETHFDADAIVSGYPAELRQVFTNLLTNALEASVAGSTIRVTVQHQEAAGATPRGVTATIRDSGKGIDAETMPRLFQPFFTTKGEHGTGLGLWVSQGILQKHGGTITLETNTESETHGSTVTVFLPRGETNYLPPLERVD